MHLGREGKISVGKVKVEVKDRRMECGTIERDERMRNR